MNFAAIRDAIQRLTLEERIRLIDLLWDSLSTPPLSNREAAWATESEQRIDAFEAGKLESRDAKDVFRELRNSL